MATTNMARPTLAPTGATTAAKTSSALVRRFAPVAMLGPVIFATLLALQDTVDFHWLATQGYGLVTSPVSDLALGPLGALQCVNFFLFGTAFAAGALGLHLGVGGKRSKVANGLVMLVALGLLLSVFPTDRFNAGTGNAIETTWHGAIHNIAFYIFALSQIPAYIAMRWRLRRDPRFARQATYSLVAGLAVMPLFLVCISLPAVFPWFYVWLALVPMAWLEVMAVRLWQVSRRADSSR